MKKNDRGSRRVLSGILAAVTAVLLLFPGVTIWAEEAGSIHISSAEDLIELAQSCTLDTWSRGKTVILDGDIDLGGAEFAPIPTFGGTFEGKGHTIFGLEIRESVAPAGLFAVLQSSGKINALTVQGTVAPEGDCQAVGGIVGENYGWVVDCSFSGTVSGTRQVGGIAGKNGSGGVIRTSRSGGAIFGDGMVGGIAGYNQGRVVSCQNGAYVNIESADQALDLSTVDVDLTLDLSRLSRSGTANAPTDVGGVAGYSTGYILNCTNQAAVGYEHVGYNVGGIAGRSSGQVDLCTNSGSVCGRKDVGGIIGQMEPYIQMELSQSSLSQLQTQLSELSALVDQAAAHAEGNANGISSRLNELSGYVSSAQKEAENIQLNASAGATITAGGVTPGSGTITVTPGDDPTQGGSVDVSYLPGTGTVSGSAEIAAVPDFGGLTSSVNGINSQLTMLNGAVNGTVGTVSSDIRQINAKFNEISNTVSDAIAGAETTVSDTSAVDVDQITLGKAGVCQNSGSVYGDLNVGGISGAMALEYQLDPEDDVSSGTGGRKYEYKAVVQLCVNTGEITGKRSYTGGIAGKMDLGLITDCQSYGPVTSENGSYVGGIAGLTGASVRRSYAKCTLSGKKYVGGIVGSGVTETVSGGGSTVAGCYSLVDITGVKQYSGAVAGLDAGSFLENYYVSDSLAGINRRSVAGQAEPITFAQLRAAAGIPERMTQFTITFVADDQVLLKENFDYGDSFDPDKVPALPEKEGSIARWDRTDLTDLHFDTVVTAVYTAFTPGVAAEPLREDGRAVFLVGGNFQSGDSLSVTAEPLTPSAFRISTGDLGSRIRTYLSGFGQEDFSLLRANWEAVEQWSLLLPEDGQRSHTVRYLPPGGASGRLRIYAEENGHWQRLDCETVGSYLTFALPGTGARIAAVSTIAVWWAWLLLAILILAAILIPIILGHRRIRKRRAKRKAKAAENAFSPADFSLGDEAAPQPAAVGAANGEKGENLPLSGENSPENTEKAPSLPPIPNDGTLSRTELAEARLAQVEEELRLLRESRGDVGAHQAPATGKKHFRWWIIPLVLVILAAAAGVFFLVKSGLGNDLEAYHLLKTYLQDEPAATAVTVNAGLGSQTLNLEGELYRFTDQGVTVSCVEEGGAALYFAKNTLYLENGKAYALGGGCPELSELLPQAAELCRLIQVDRKVSGSEKTYTLTAEGEDAAKLLTCLLPEDWDAQISALDVTLTSRDGKLEALRVAAAQGSELSLEAVFTPLEGAETPQVPETVRTAIAAGDTGSRTLSGALWDLVQAGSAVYGRSTLSADVTLSADCGPVVFQDTLRYDRKALAGQNILRVERSPYVLYSAGNKLCDAQGTTVTDTLALTDKASLVELAWQLALNGEVTVREEGDAQLYSLDLDQAGMERVAYAIAPDVRSQALTLTGGDVTLTVKNGELTAISLSCTGTVQVVVAQVQARLEADIAFTQREADFPQSVIDALRQ